MRCLLAALSISCALLTPTLAQSAGPPLPCPDDKLEEVVRQKPVPDLVTAIIPPLAILNLLHNDPLAKLPTRNVTFRVVDEQGRAVPNALVGLIYLERKRFLAEGAAGGPAIRVPHGRYAVNAAIAGKDRGVRYGSAEVTIDAKGPSSVTVKLTGKAAPATTQTASTTVPVGNSASFEFTSALRESAALALVRPGANIRTPPSPEHETIVSQFLIEGSAAPAMSLPGKAGKYDVVAMLCAPRIQLARWSIATTPARIAIEAPARIQAGSVLRATVSGQLNPAYQVEVRQTGGFAKLTRKLNGGDREELEVAVGYTEGDYQIEITTHDRVVLASRTVALDPVQFAITGPERINVGGDAAFSWPGKEEHFRLELWTLAERGKPARRIGELRDSGRVVAAPGSYEVRLRPWSRNDDRVLARKPITVEGKVFEEVPPGVAPASTVSVRLAMKPHFFDRLVFVKRGGDASNGDGRANRGGDDRVMTADAPKTPGSYDLVYMMGMVGVAVEAARAPIEVR